MIEQERLIPDEPLVLQADSLPITFLEREDVPAATKQLEDSIRRFGLLQPILVRKTMVAVHNVDGHELPGIEYDVVDGRRRLWCCRKLGMESVPVLIAETDLAIADVATLATNATRTSNPVAEYDAVMRLMRGGASEREVATATGMSVQAIRARMRLGNLIGDLDAAFRQGKIGVTVAESAARLNKEAQKAIAATLFVKGRVTLGDIHDVRTARSQQSMAQLSDTMFDLAEPLNAPVDENPQEYGLALEIQSIIERMPKEQKVYIKSLEWVASGLMDIAVGASFKEVEGSDAETMQDERDDEPDDYDTSDETPYPVELADDERR